MTDLAEQFELPLTLRVPRSAFVIVAPQPATVTRRTVEQNFGIPPRMYKDMARNGVFPSKRIGHMVFAAYDDVKRAVTDGAARRKQPDEAVRSAVTDPEVKVVMSADAALRYLASARTPREKRERKKEVSSLAWELMTGNEPTLADGSPNPKHDKGRYDHGTALILATMGLVLKDTSTASPSEQRSPVAPQASRRSR